MQVAGLLLPFILLGIGVIFVAFSGGPGSARETYLTRGGRGLRILAPLLFLALGVLIPAIILVSRDEKASGTPQLASAELTPEMARGKDLFRANCASCHALAAINARGVTGPNLDEIGAVNR